ncbi:hypothetical protein FBZ96_11360 [Bradyrhizobium stylosanthis]|uniref:Uncharacterized protein n=2 Tax=Bradyrhizobium stylosanthis TaxID=1803665 RepID=A0A560D2L3_9BRAD|nr:hypothetical protein FBZ96_11360 [Bradyrhizobium stylosanthis]
MVLREEPARYEAVPDVDNEEPLKIAYALVQKRRLSKRMLLDTMSVLGAKPTRGAMSGTTRQLLEWFFAEATPSQSDKFLSLLGNDKQDQYLKGIVKRE